MAFNGSGTFGLASGNPVVTGTTISSTTHNNTMSDIASGLTNCVTRDGQSPATANIPLGSNKITGLAAGASLTDAAQVAQVQSSAVQYLTGVAGTDTITAGVSPSPSAYSAGMTFRFASAGANTGAVTLNVASLGAKSVTKNGTVPLVAGEIASGAIVEVCYDGTRFQLISQSSSLPYKHISGLRLSNNATDPTNDIDIAVGECRSSTDAYDMALASTLTKRLDAAWAAGTGNGGIDAGSKAISTWYHVWLIRKDSDGTIDALFSTSASAPTMPAGYTAKRLIGSILTDSAGAIETFSQFGDIVQWKENMGLDVNTAVLGTSRTSYALGSVPTGYEVEVHFNMTCTSAGSEVVTVSQPDQLDAAPSQTVWPLSSASSRARDQGNKRCVTNTAAQVAARSSVASTSLYIAVTGYRYLREVM